MKTKLLPEVQSKIQYIDLSQSPYDGVKEQYLTRYQDKLSTTTGVIPTFDARQKLLLLKYGRDKVQLAREIDYLNRLQDDVGHFGRSWKCYEMMSDAFMRFAQPNYTSFRWCKTYQSELQRLKDYYGQFKATVLVYTSDDEVIDYLPKTDTSSGFTKLITGKPLKGDVENKENILNRLLDFEKTSVEKKSMGRPILVSHRSQASGEYSDDNERTDTFKRKVRVVSMVDELQIASERRFQYGIQKVLGLLDSYAGGYSLDKIGQCISTWRKMYNFYVSVDYSSYDQTISDWLIEDAFSILKQMVVFEEDWQLDLWDAMVNGFIHKEFVLSEGVLKSSKGVPSGSMWTQIIDSIVNQLVIGTYLQSIGEKSFDMMIMGDDNIIFTKTELNNEFLASYLRKNFGLEVNASKFDSGNTRKNPKFLSVEWRFNGRWRAPYQILSRLLFPERFREYAKRVKILREENPFLDTSHWTDEQVRSWVDKGYTIQYVLMDPMLVMYCYILTYPLAMSALIDVNAFLADMKVSGYDMSKVDGRLLSGLMAYLQTYGKTG